MLYFEAWELVPLGCARVRAPERLRSYLATCPPVTVGISADREAVRVSSSGVRKLRDQPPEPAQNDHCAHAGLGSML